MIQLSEVFNMIGVDGCMDVATSLGMQGGVPEISIPIYEVFYLKIVSAQHTQYLAGSIPEASALRQIAINCGGLCCTINLLDLDILTLLGCLCVYTPNTGMSVFIKNNIPDLAELTSDVIGQLSSMAGIPFEVGEECVDLAVEAINMLFDRLLDRLEDNLASYGIALRHWEELPAFFELVNCNGDMQTMRKYRSMTNAATM